jgi:hypothetical protein
MMLRHMGWTEAARPDHHSMEKAIRDKGHLRLRAPAWTAHAGVLLRLRQVMIEKDEVLVGLWWRA